MTDRFQSGEEELLLAHLAAFRALLDRSFTEQVVMVLYSTLNGADLEALAAECGAHGS